MVVWCSVGDLLIRWRWLCSSIYFPLSAVVFHPQSDPNCDPKNDTLRARRLSDGSLSSFAQSRIEDRHVPQCTGIYHQGPRHKKNSTVFLNLLYLLFSTDEQNGLKWINVWRMLLSCGCHRRLLRIPRRNTIRVLCLVVDGAAPELSR